MREYLRRPDGALVPLADGLTIGRHAGCAIALDHSSVSRAHAAVRGVGGRWFIEDRGSRNGTLVNGTRLPFGAQHPLRHDDRISVGAFTLDVVLPGQHNDPDGTHSLELRDIYQVHLLSPFQHQVVQCLSEPWQAGGEPASNAEIAVRLGTPDAVDGVKAALRRVYAKTGLTEVNSGAKRRELCLFARRNGWL